MERKLFIIATFVAIICFSSCKKEFSCEGCRDNNKPPTAVAGPDQIINLPTDSILLDGSASSDHDGTISVWLWKKISGPASFTIINTASAKTVVKNILEGIYKFELKVTDDKNLSATDTVQVTVVDPVQANRPPISNAGPDQAITLPTNTVTLNGNASSDPDNNITAYVWTKISGPSTFNIVNSIAVQTQVTNLVEGVYMFELKVTDAGGLFSNDTIRVTVNTDLQIACDNSNRPLVNARLVPIGTLSKPRAQIAVAYAGTKIVFAGGRWTPDCPDCWGTSRVDIYDTVTRQWSTAELSQGRWGIATVAVGNKIFFAGGEWGDGAYNGLYSNVDIYDLSSNSWTVASLSEKRSYIAAATVGNKVFFAGGSSEDITWFPATSQVDIYDLSSNSWSTTVLSEARGFISPVVVNQKIYFAGGFNNSISASDKIDIYDDLTQSWNTSVLMKPMASPAGIAFTGNIYWAYGCDVEIKNTSTWTSATGHLFRPGGWRIDDGQNAVLKDNKIIFFRATAPTNKFDIYNIATNTWSIGVLPESFNYENISIIAVNNTIYIAGGSNGGATRNDQVWKLEF